MSSLTSPTQTSTKDASKARKQLWLNLFCIGLLALVVLGCFHRTVFRGQPISRVYQLGQRDTLYSKYFVPAREGYDASVYQYFVPSHYFLTEQLKKGVLPLWNPLAGCGAPFLADVETAVFWPARLLTLFLQPLKAWNLLIVCNLVNFAIGTFVLGKLMNLRRYAIIFASLTMAFCPFLVFQSELIGSSSSMIPWVMASFVYMHKSRRLLAKPLAGFACAVMILSGHPEPSFFGIVCSSMLLICMSILDSGQGSTWWKRSGESLLDIAIVGAFAFGFCSFMLLPFLELLKTSDCYKLGLTGHRFGVPLNSILVNLLHPAYGNSSPFLGILCVPLVLIGAWFSFGKGGDKGAKALLICSLISIALMSQLGPLDLLMNSKAFSWFVPKYCWPSLLLMISILSGYGFQCIVDDSRQNWRRSSILALTTCLISLAALCAVRMVPSLLECIRQDEAFDHMQIISKFWTRDIILITIFGVVVALSKLLRKAQAPFIVLTGAILTVLSIAPVTKQAAPITGPFNYDLVDPIPFLQQSEQRIVTMGRHVLCPSTNFCFGINNIVPVNVYHPKRFQNFLIAMGVTPEGVNQFFDGRLNPATAMASVKYVVTPQPVLDKSESLPEPILIKISNKVTWGDNDLLELKGAGLRYDPQNNELLGSIKINVDTDKARDIALQPILLDEHDNVLWLGDAERLLYLFAKTGNEKRLELVKDLVVPVPKSTDKALLALQAFDWRTMKFLQLGSTSYSADTTKQKLALAKIDAKAGLVQSDLFNPEPSSESRNFKLVQETASHVRVYENTLAQPMARLATSVIAVRNADDALAQITSGAKNEQYKIVLDANDSLAAFDKLQVLSNSIGLNSSQHNADRAKFQRKDCNNIEVNVETAARSILLVAENYYPGWSASIEQDGKSVEAEIMHGDYLFQAIEVPSGKSKVHLHFEPKGFSIGLIILSVTSIIAALVIAFDLKNTKTRLPERQD